MRLFHGTTAANADSILISGFRDNVGKYMTERSLTGVWLTDRPDLATDLRVADVFLAIDVPDDVAALAFVDEEGRPYGEWMMQAAELNKYPARLALDDELLGGSDQW